jgi:hypothetical protein
MNNKKVASELMKVAQLLTAKDEGKEIGSVYLHISNSGVTFKVVDKGFGPTIVVYSSSFGNAINELEIITHGEALAALGELFTECSKETYSKEYNGGLAKLSEKKIPHKLPETMYGEKGTEAKEKTKKAWRDEGYGEKLRDVEKQRWNELEQGNNPQHEHQAEREYQRWKRTVEKAFNKEQLESFGEDQLRHLFDSEWSFREAIDFIRNKV